MTNTNTNTNANLETQLEKDVYKAGNDIYKNKLTGLKLDTNQAGLMDDLIAECLDNSDFASIERIGLKHKTFDFKNDNVGKKGEPLNCKAFKTAISKAFERADLELSLQGCGKGGTPKVDTKQAPKGKAKVTKPASQPAPSEVNDELVWDYVIDNYTLDQLEALVLDFKLKHVKAA